MTNNTLARRILNGTAVALAVLIVAKTDIVNGITCTDALTLIVVVILLGFLNTVLRPIVLLLAMPLVLASFGLLLLPVLWLANALVLYLVGNTLGLDGFHVATFKAAMWGSLWISIFAFFIGRLLGGNDLPRSPGGPGAPRGGKKTDTVDDAEVIDV